MNFNSSILNIFPRNIHIMLLTFHYTDGIKHFTSFRAVQFYIKDDVSNNYRSFIRMTFFVLYYECKKDKFNHID